MTRDEARERIRNNLTKRGRHFVNVTDGLILHWWHVCNKAIFRGRLTPPRVRARFRRFDWGYCEPNLIVISTDAFTRELFLDTLIHEMVHQWELENSKYWGHGKGFMRWKRRIERYVGVTLDAEGHEDDYKITDGQRQLFKRRHQSSKRSRSR